MSDENLLRDIEIARLAFIGASVVTLGDGISVLAAWLALNALEHDYTNSDNRHNADTESAKVQLEHYINELIQIQKILK
ncbi:translation initiation factor 2 [Paenibacillus pasadenensis]|uniref:translation initiation factor 2 n=1 Tax=Paenibacillus pasadenensis TaxID=217090 RepID=UPI00203DF19B|nr:translation initiation factor 2 [Paenibacillus pasadenensis]MCM3746094.1 translation initiation factor 2 [Paenibacillus pasadenensis]